MRSIMSAIPLSCAFVLCAALGALAQAPTLPYDHIHLNVPDQAAGGRVVSEELRRQARSPRRPIG